MSGPLVDGDVIARTPRLQIRRRRLEDGPDEYAWRRDPETVRFNASEPLTIPYSEFLDQLERELAFDDPRRGAFAVDTVAGEHIGSVMYYNGSAAHQDAELGMSIGSECYRGAGLGREMAIGFIRYIWQSTPYRLIYLHTLGWNERARRCFRGAGFDETARVYRAGEWFVRMEARREWWLMWEQEGRFQSLPAVPTK